jgi:hypothetical protein
MDTSETEHLPLNVKPLSTTWFIKKKANGDFRARITAQGFHKKKECITGVIL